jgi:hypothetical protein
MCEVSAGRVAIDEADRFVPPIAHDRENFSWLPSFEATIAVARFVSKSPIFGISREIEYYSLKNSTNSNDGPGRS